MLGESGLICGGLIRGVVHALEKRWTYLWWSLYALRGLVGGEIRYFCHDKLMYSFSFNFQVFLNSNLLEKL